MPKNNTIPEWMQKEVEAYDLCIVPPPQSVLDIGANIGAYSLRCAEQWPDVHISAFEPVRATWEVLRENLLPFPNSVPHHMAVRAESGADKMFIGDLPVTCSFHQLGRQTKNTLHVQAIAAHLVRPAELVKIDTEGCEVEILEGLNLDSTRALVVECHSDGDRVRIIEMIEAKGFQLIWFLPGNTGHGVLKFAKGDGVTLPLAPQNEPALEAMGVPPLPDKLRKAQPMPDRKVRKVYLAIAGHFANNDVIFVQSLLAMAIQPQVSTAFGWSCDPSVERARNILTANFLESDCTHILFVDADIGFSSADVERICGHEELVVGGLYPLKTMTESVQWCANGLQPGDALVREDGLTEVKYAGTGFLCIAREVFEALKQHIAVLPYTQDFPPHRKEICYWFQRVCNGRFLTEDWNFSQLCQDLRFKIFLDSKVVLRHSGRAEWPLPIQKGNPFLPQKETKETKP